MTISRLGQPNLGLGVGLRSVHFAHILEHWPKVDWFEVISENFMDSQGRPRYVPEQIAERYPIVMHGAPLAKKHSGPLPLATCRNTPHVPILWESWGNSFRSISRKRDLVMTKQAPLSAKGPRAGQFS
ncbi:MAG: DUF692 family protein [Candidatus Hydrogenedentes bacterium]|nr:DUF692 family protein [Candidatus Hydrogenedentota bacterium]